MFGRKKVKDKQKQRKEKPVVYWDVDYVGGHIIYPEGFNASIVLWNHQMKIKHDTFDDADMVIRYEKIKNIRNVSQ
ncbi:MAG: hypothetical protein WA941_11510 [Nitrososphaeraceae archaeon]